MYIYIYIYKLPPKLYYPKMEYLLFLRYKRSPSFYKGFDQTFTNICAASRSHRFEQVAAASVCARISTVTRRPTKILEEATVAAKAGAVAVAAAATAAAAAAAVTAITGVTAVTALTSLTAVTAVTDQ